jgi:DNA-binding beta-propeller fold protein YncE
MSVDDDGNVYVSDTSNRRVEIFDADGNFISAFGKAGDGPGRFMRPKGIAVDADGHVWVADAGQDRVQVFSREGKLLLHMGGHGMLPGQFGDVTGLTIDKKNRVFTSDQYPGRVQMFQYITNPEARAEYDRRQKLDKKTTGTAATASQAPAVTESKPKEEGSVPKK